MTLRIHVFCQYPLYHRIFSLWIMPKKSSISSMDWVVSTLWNRALCTSQLNRVSSLSPNGFFIVFSKHCLTSNVSLRHSAGDILLCLVEVKPSFCANPPLHLGPRNVRNFYTNFKWVKTRVQWRGITRHDTLIVFYESPMMEYPRG